jgi:hypothetical protein
MRRERRLVRRRFTWRSLRHWFCHTILGSIWRRHRCRGRQHAGRRGAEDINERLSACFRQYAEHVYRDLTGYVSREQEAEEVTQEVFLLLYQAWRSGEQIERPDVWLFTAARRLMLDRFKKKQPTHADG